MNENSNGANDLVFSYLTLRKTIGYLGTLFPFILAVGGSILFGDGLQRSVSPGERAYAEEASAE